MQQDGRLRPDGGDLEFGEHEAQRLLVGELDRDLQRDVGISKAEFSVLVTLLQAPERQLRIGEIAETLGWDKSRVSHQLSRTENRGSVERTERGAEGRRMGVGLTPAGRRAAQNAVDAHGRNIRRHFLDALSPAQAAALRIWSEQTIDRLAVRVDLNQHSTA